MIALDDLLSETTTTVARFGAHEMKVTYRPGVFTPARVSAVEKAVRSSQAEGERATGQFLVDLLADWDLVTTVGGDKVPITVESIMGLPMQLNEAIQRAIRQELMPSGEASASSPSG